MANNCSKWFHENSFFLKKFSYLVLPVYETKSIIVRQLILFAIIE